MIREGYQQTAIGLIPCDWEVRELGQIAVIGSGGTPSRINNSYWNGNIPWITTSQINFNVITSADEFITKLGLQNSAAKMYEEGTLLMAMYGQGKTRGKVAILGINATINQACASINLNENVCSEYILANLSSRYEEIRKLSNTGNQENLNGKLIKSLPIPLPPLPEQKAIAEVLGDVDRLINACDKLIAKKRDIKQGAMQELLTGRSRLPGFSGEWEVKDIKEIVDNNRIPSGIYKEQKDYGNGTKIIKISDVFSNDFYIPELAQRVKLSYAEKSKYAVKTGDIIIALASVKLEGVGKVMLVKKLDEITTFDHNVALIRLKNDIESNYVFYILKSNLVRKIIASAATQVGTTFLKTSTILKFSIPLPPTPEEQKAIAQILSDMDSEIKALEKKRDKYKLVKQGMMQELLTGKTRLL